MRVPTERELNFYKFTMQSAVTFIILDLCIFKLSQTKVKSWEVALYWGGLSGIAGYWMPSPLAGKNSQTIIEDSRETNVINSDPPQ